MKFVAMKSFIVLILLSAVSLSVHGISFKSVVDDIKKGVNIANGFLGENGEIPRGNGCNVKWNIQGTLRGIEWKWICTCIDKCTGTVEVQTKSSREGAMEHCYSRLFATLARNGDL